MQLAISAIQSCRKDFPTKQYWICHCTQVVKIKKERRKVGQLDRNLKSKLTCCTAWLSVLLAGPTLTPIPMSHERTFSSNDLLELSATTINERFASTLSQVHQYLNVVKFVCEKRKHKLGCSVRAPPEIWGVKISEIMYHPGSHQKFMVRPKLQSLVQWATHIMEWILIKKVSMERSKLEKMKTQICLKPGKKLLRRQKRW